MKSILNLTRRMLLLGLYGLHKQTHYMNTNEIQPNSAFSMLIGLLCKYSDTTCTKAGANILFVEMMLGQKLPGMVNHYFKPTESDLLEGNDRMLGYIVAIGTLTINEENRSNHCE